MHDHKFVFSCTSFGVTCLYVRLLCEIIGFVSAFFNIYICSKSILAIPKGIKWKMSTLHLDSVI